jgi:hypothetical protein
MTTPYFSAPLSLVVPYRTENVRANIFHYIGYVFKPFHWSLWAFVVCLMIFCGAFFAVIEPMNHSDFIVAGTSRSFGEIFNHMTKLTNSVGGWPVLFRSFVAGSQSVLRKNKQLVRKHLREEGLATPRNAMGSDRRSTKKDRGQAENMGGLTPSDKSFLLRIEQQKNLFSRLSCDLWFVTMHSIYLSFGSLTGAGKHTPCTYQVMLVWLLGTRTHARTHTIYKHTHTHTHARARARTPGQGVLRFFHLLLRRASVSIHGEPCGLPTRKAGSFWVPNRFPKRLLVAMDRKNKHTQHSHHSHTDEHTHSCSTHTRARSLSLSLYLFLSLSLSLSLSVSLFRRPHKIGDYLNGRSSEYTKGELLCDSCGLAISGIGTILYGVTVVLLCGCWMLY